MQVGSARDADGCGGDVVPLEARLPQGVGDLVSYEGTGRCRVR